MVDVGTAALQIIPSFQGFQGKLESGSAGSMIAAGASGGKKFGDAAGRSMVSSIRSHARTAAFAASAGLVAAGAVAFKIGRESLAEAREAQKVGALTESTIKATGAAANVTAKQVGDLAGAISLKTGIDDEAIQSGANMLLTFKNIRNEAGAGNDIFNQTTKTLIDLSAAMGTDAKSSAIQLGKALNDPITGVTALTRVGVTFTEQQKEQIKTLVENGKTMEAQKLILRELNSEFGGAAAAQATLGDKVSVAWGNIEEQLGTALIPLVEKAERVFLRKGVPAIEGWVDAFQNKGVPAIQDFYREAKPVAEAVLPALGDALGQVRDFAKETAPYVADVAKAFADMPDWAQKAIVGGGLAAAAGSKLGLGSLLTGSRGGASGGLLGAFTKASPMPVYVVNSVPGVGSKTGPGGLPLLTGGAEPTPGGSTAKSGLRGKLGGLGGKIAPFVPILPGAFPDTLPAPEMLGGIEEFNAAIGKTEAGVKDASAAVGGFGGALDDISPKVRSLIISLPDKLITEMKLTGVPRSAQEAIELSRKYDLAAQDRQTLFKTAGISQAQAEVARYAMKLTSLPKWITSNVQLTGIEAAQQQIASLRASIDAVEGRGDHIVPYVHGGQSAGRVAASSPRPTSRRRSQPIVLQVGEREVAGVLHDYIGTNDDLADERRRAGATR